MGDGVLVYFGYPQASEDAAERAVKASLRAIAAVNALPPIGGQPLASRIGIATGPVVIGEGLAREVNVVGETPNLAARLAGPGGANSAVLSEVTARMVAGSFALDDRFIDPERFSAGLAALTEATVAVLQRSGGKRGLLTLSGPARSRRRAGPL
jgi:class 3 adenylate cyclase